MSEIAVTADGLGKRYRIGGPSQRYGRLTEAISDRLRSPFRGRPAFDHIWALKDVSLEIKEGEVVGIIGRNGAGKTTLLKILSRITTPTEGRAELRGRVGSLLEVGTGFHPELSGRENVYLNGAILGMRRAEIERKFDEIVAFSEVEKFLDTPVKRYSSGMQVRLAFAVAAHLQPEILIVDEVLAVGDIAFQKRSIGRMREVSRGGRTVLFVSHNMAAVHRLCERVVLLDRGRVHSVGPTSKVVASYVELAGRDLNTAGSRPEGSRVRLTRAVLTAGGRPVFALPPDASLELEIEFEVHEDVAEVRIGVWILTSEGFVVTSTFDTDDSPELLRMRRAGRYRNVVRFPKNLLNSGEYLIRILAYEHYGLVHDENTELVLQITDPSGESAATGWGHRVGPVSAPFEWTTSELPAVR